MLRENAPAHRLETKRSKKLSGKGTDSFPVGRRNRPPHTPHLIPVAPRLLYCVHRTVLGPGWLRHCWPIQPQNRSRHWCCSCEQLCILGHWGVVRTYAPRYDTYEQFVNRAPAASGRASHRRCAEDVCWGQGRVCGRRLSAWLNVPCRSVWHFCRSALVLAAMDCDADSSAVSSPTHAL